MKYKEYNDNEIINYISEGNEEAINLIYEKYKPLISKIATRLYKKYCANTGLEINDLEQEGMVALSSAINYYQDSKDACFYTYAKTCIERKIISAVIGARRQKHKILNDSISFEVNIGDTDLNLNLILKDEKNIPENIVIGRESNKELMEKIEKVLTDFELKVLQLRMDGFDYKQISEIVEKDTKAVDNAIYRIRNKIKKIIE